MVLRFKGVNLKLISHIEKYQFIERIIRSISKINKNYSKAKNKFLKSYEPCKLLTYIVYIDYHNIYGYSMMQLVSQLNSLIGLIHKKIDLDNYSNNSPIGFF